MSALDFVEFPKIARFNKTCVVTEKIDGTNGQIWIREDGDGAFEPEFDTYVGGAQQVIVRAGSRNRWLTRGGKTDNFGFGEWVAQHAEELAQLGPGHHYGEWWGLGIGRRYGLTAERRFSLFNVGRWRDIHGTNDTCPVAGLVDAPSCCYVVPVLYVGLFEEFEPERALDLLREEGSAAAPGFMQPEGFVLFHEAARVSFKRLLENDDVPKSMKETGSM